jgi:heme/copper-type cytochrome/quinol oxidase subunit 2
MFRFDSSRYGLTIGCTWNSPSGKPPLDIAPNKKHLKRILLVVTTSPTNIFAPASTPAGSIFGLSIFVLVTVTAIFVVVFALLAYAVVRFRKRRDAGNSEPVQIYGSTRAELAWTVIPVSLSSPSSWQQRA